MKEQFLKNNIKVSFEESPSTPRTAFCFCFRFKELEKKPGVYTLISRLLLQGTKSRTAEQIASELDDNAIELYTDLKNDFIRLRLFTLNEDFEYSLELLEDIIKNSTFENFDKEVEKLRGEIVSDLDSPRVKAQDNFYKTLFENHPYGNTATKILESLDTLNKEEIVEEYKKLISTSKKNISVAGDINVENVCRILEKYFGTLENSQDFERDKRVFALSADKTVIIEKEDANQAQIYMGFVFPPALSPDYPKFLLLNTILGAGGLSARLFYELREKRGLAYVVRSSLEKNIEASCFSVYIATEPKNIRTSLDGFKKELDRISNEPVSEKELSDAKNNFLGRRQFYFETNLLKSTMTGQSEVYGLGNNCEEKLLNAIRKITKEELQECAKKYFATPKVLSVLAPREYLEKAGLTAQ